MNTLIINSNTRTAGTTTDDATYKINWDFLKKGRYRLSWKYVETAPSNYTPFLLPDTAYYPFDGDIKNYKTGSGVVDATVNTGYTAKFDSTVAGHKVGTSAYQFDVSAINTTWANGNWINTGVITRTPNMSFAGWFKFTNPGSQAQVVFSRLYDIGGGSNFRLHINNSNSIRWNDLILVSTTNFLNIWTHIVWTTSNIAPVNVGGATARFYINGVLNRTNNLTSLQLQTGSGTGFFGHSFSGNDPNYQGFIDDFRFYSRTLTQAEITSIFTNII